MAHIPFVGTGLTVVSPRKLYNPPIVRYNGMKYHSALGQLGERTHRTARPLFAIPGSSEGEQRSYYVTP